MNHLATRRRKRLGGISAKAIGLPLAIVIALLQVAIIVLIVFANFQNEKFSDTIEEYADYQGEASRMIRGASVLKETSTIYVRQQGEGNVGALLGYAAELRDHPERRFDAVADKFEFYDVGEEAKTHIRLAKRAAESMFEIQLHAISLMLSAYPSADPDLKDLKTILDEKGYSYEPAPEAERADLAAQAEALLTGGDYTQRMGEISNNVTLCTGALENESSAATRQIMSNIRGLRVALLVTTATLSLLLISSFLVLYVWLVSPLTNFVRGIGADRPLNEKTGLYEVRRLADSYNALLRRRESLETVLRFAAETDQLTNLPNRYRFEQYFYDAGKGGYPVAFLVFDVNHLKETNDKKGHLAGDELIRGAAECIGECFGVPGENNCFRIGGDEFAAIVKHVSRDEIDRRIAWFAERQKETDVSVAVGLAYAEEIGDTNFRDMFLTADRNMYSDKMREHSERKKAKHNR